MDKNLLNIRALFWFEPQASARGSEILGSVMKEEGTDGFGRGTGKAMLPQPAACVRDSSLLDEQVSDSAQ
jgi:hypothetical protein